MPCYIESSMTSGCCSLAMRVKRRWPQLMMMTRTRTRMMTMTRALTATGGGQWPRASRDPRRWWLSRRMMRIGDNSGRCHVTCDVLRAEPLDALMQDDLRFEDSRRMRELMTTLHTLADAKSSSAIAAPAHTAAKTPASSAASASSVSSSGAAKSTPARASTAKSRFSSGGGGGAAAAVGGGGAVAGRR